ncbi:MAG TPA: hypothetical protein VK943_16810 [Arenibaculum sp.]|nr:hypothetical protein [Arenibaculum sp.]
MSEAWDGRRTFYRRLQGYAGIGAGAGLALAGLGWWLAPHAFPHAWLGAFVLWTGLALGCLLLLMVGHLLGEDWLGPLRGELEAGALTLPLLGAAAVPVLLGLGTLYPWAPTGAEGDPDVAFRSAWLSPVPFAVRSVGYFVVWGLFAWIVTRPGGHHRTASAAGLVLVLPTTTLAAADWVMSLHPQWMSSVFGLAFGTGQATAAFAAAVLVATLRPDREPPGRIGQLAGALLVLLAATAYLWFVQFLIVWSANLPDEVSWYLERGGGWAWLMPGTALPAAGIAAALLLTRRARAMRPVLIAASLLLLVQHTANHYWQIRPSVPELGLHWTDPVAVAALGLACLVVFAHALPGRPVRAERAAGNDPVPPERE